MTKKDKTVITVEVTVKATIEKVWEFWSTPGHVLRWNSASDEWHTTRAENDLRVGGKFLSRMEAKDGSVGFDFEGRYDVVKLHELITYTMPDGRKVEVHFLKKGNSTLLRESFEAEETNSIEMQKSGWQAILNNFKKYVESL